MPDEVEMTDLRKQQSDQEDNETSVYTPSPPVRTAAPHQVGVYCGKVVYILGMMGLLLICCVVLANETQAEMRDIALVRAKENKVNQLRIISTMMETLTGTIQNIDLRQDILIALARKLNLRHMVGSYEVVLLETSQCSGKEMCELRVLSDLRNARKCKATHNADGTLKHKCDFHTLATLGAQVNFLSPTEFRVVTATDYTESSPESVIAFKKLNGTRIGVVLKQDLEEALSVSVAQSSYRWYSAVIIFTAEVLLVVGLVVVVQYIQEGSGYTSMFVLHVVAVGAFLSIVILMGFTATLEEGVKQQERETSSSASLMLSVHDVVAEMSLDKDSLIARNKFADATQQWMKAINDNLPESFEAHIFSTGGNALDSELLTVDALKGFCPEICQKSLAAALAEFAQDASTRFRINANPGTMDHYSREIDSGVMVASYFTAAEDGHRTGFAWLVRSAYVTRPFDDAVETLWKQTGALCAGYVSAAVIASLLMCYLLPKMEGRGRKERVRLSRAFPYVALSVLLFTVVLTVISAVVSLRSMALEAEAQERQTKGVSVVQSAQDLTMKFSTLESVWVSSLALGKVEQEAQFTAIESEIFSGLVLLSKAVRELYHNQPRAAEVIIVAESLSGWLSSLSQSHLHQQMRMRSSDNMQGNSSYVLWSESPDTSCDTARASLRAITADLEKAGILKMGTLRARLLEVENILLDLQVLYREYVILSTGVEAKRLAFEARHKALTVELTTKLDTLTTDVNLIVSQSAFGATTTTNTDGTRTTQTSPAFVFDSANLGFIVENLKSNIDQHLRGATRFAQPSVVDVETNLDALMKNSVLCDTVLPSVKLLKDDLSQEAHFPSVRTREFFVTIKQQLRVLETNALQEVLQHSYLRSDLELEEARMKRATSCSILLIVITSVAAIVSIIWYIKEATCNLGAGGSYITMFPNVEMKDIGMILALIMVVQCTEVGLIRYFAHKHFEGIRETDTSMNARMLHQQDLSLWMNDFSQYLLSGSSFITSGAKVFKEDMENYKKAFQRHTYSAHLFNSGDIEGNKFQKIRDLAAVVEDMVEAGADARETFDAERGQHTYSSLRLLLQKTKKDGNIQQFFQHVSEKQIISTDTRKGWITSYSKPWIDMSLTCSFALVKGKPAGTWSPRTLLFESGMGYRLVLRNDFSGPVVLNVERLLRNSAVHTIYTKDTEWEVPYVVSISLQPGGEVTVIFIVVATGVFDLFDDSQVHVTARVEGVPQDTGLDPGLSAEAERRILEDPRSKHTHPVWATAPQSTAKFYVPPLNAGFYSENPHISELNRYMQMLKVGNAYRFVFHNDGEVCRWVSQPRYCSADVSFLLGTGVKATACGSLTLATPVCQALFTSNDDVCLCLRKGETCDFQYNTQVPDTKVYTQVCDFDSATAAKMNRSTGVDLSSLEGHVLVGEVGDSHVSLNVPHALSVSLTYNNEKPDTQKSAYVDVVPIDKGYFVIPAVHSEAQSTSLQSYKDLLGITGGCFLYPNASHCFSDLGCLWDGMTCTQPETLPLYQNNGFAQSTLPDNVVTYLLLSQSVKIAHSHHLAYLLFDQKKGKESRRLSEQYQEQFNTIISRINGQSSRTLKAEFEAWEHALQLEREVRETLFGMTFLEDVLGQEPGLSKELVELRSEVTKLTDQRTMKLSRVHHFSTRMLFWSCCIVAWLMAAVGCYLYSRLHLVVRLSEPYCFRNVPTAIGMERTKSDKNKIKNIIA